MSKPLIDCQIFVQGRRFPQKQTCSKSFLALLELLEQPEVSRHRRHVCAVVFVVDGGMSFARCACLIVDSKPHYCVGLRQICRGTSTSTYASERQHSLSHWTRRKAAADMAALENIRARFESLSKSAFVDVNLPRSSDVDVATLIRDGKATEIGRIPARRNLFFGMSLLSNKIHYSLLRRRTLRRASQYPHCPQDHNKGKRSP